MTLLQKPFRFQPHFPLHYRNTMDARVSVKVGTTKNTVVEGLIKKEVSLELKALKMLSFIVLVNQMYSYL